MECKIKCPNCNDKGINYITRRSCTSCDGTAKIEGCPMRQRLMAAFPHLTEATDFHRHESDLYVLDHDGKIRDWLRTNYEFYTNVQTFIGESRTPWAGKRCLDIPFAAMSEKHPNPGKSKETV